MPNDQRGPFTIPSGKLKLRGIDYTFPASQQAGVLLDDGAGNLGWGQHAGPFNAVVNGDFSVFQLGNSPSPAALGARYADCWYGSVVGLTFTHAQYTGVQQIGNHWSTSMLAVNPLTGDASPAAGDYSTLIHIIEGWRARPLLNGCALSFWIVPPVSGIMTASIQNRAQTWSYLMEFPVTSAQWNYCTAVIPAFNSTIIGTSNMTTNVGLYLFLSQMLGSTNAGTATGAWQNVGKIGTTNQTNFFALGGATTYFWGVNLIPGTQPMPFIPRGYDYELAQAMRYRQVLASANGHTVGAGQVIGTTTAYIPYRNAIETVAAPSLVASAVGSYCIWSSNGSTVTTTSLGLTAATPRSGLISCGVAASPGVVAGNATILQQQAAGQMYLEAYPS